MTTISKLGVEYQPIMVDCETLGTTPNTTPVLQLALVSFDPQTFEAKEEFEIFLPLNEQLQKGRKPDQGTVDWWGKQNADVLKYIMEGVNAANPMSEQLFKVYHWILGQCERTGKKPNAQTVFYAKPAAFDFPFVDGLFQEYKVPSPFHYRDVIDIHSHLVSMFQTAFFYTYKYELPRGAAVDMYWLFNDWAKTQEDSKREEIAHNATADCHYQLEWVRWAKEHCDRMLSYYDSHQEVKGYLKELKVD